MVRATHLLAVGFLLIQPGCVGPGGLVNNGSVPPGDGTQDGDDQDGLPGENGTDEPEELAVSLTVSNPTPQVNEELFLTCEVIAGQADGVVFSFEPASGRLAVDSTRGLASLVIQETDAGQSVSFTCSARNALGQTATSPPRRVTPNL